MRELFDTLQERRRPEDVARLIRDSLDLKLTRAESRILNKAANASLKSRVAAWTSMLETFLSPIAPETTVRKALELFQCTESWTVAECGDPDRIQQLINELSPMVGKTPGASDYKSDRLNGEERAARGMDISRRRYNKLFRLLARMERKLQKYLRELRKYDFTRIGKTRLASRITWDEFARDASTAAFVAYFSARCGLRSVFTNQSQQPAYDEVSEMLFQRLVRQAEPTNWRIVAFVHPVPEVLAHLSDSHKGELLGTWLTILRDIAELLREVWEAGNIRRSTMIVQRGNDSSTWNNTASAWNKARSAWIGLLHSLGMEEELDALCLGKVLRLMAADVAHWHRCSGGTLEPDTVVWNELPLPWEVLSGDSALHPFAC